MKQELETKTRRSILRARKIGLLLRGRKSGQAVVEYILLVSIAVGLIFILKGAFSGMSEFINNYLGTYTECLMTHGELPTLGVTNSELKEHLNSGYTCNSGFKPFTLAEGRPPVGGSSSNPASKVASGKSGSSANNNANSSTTNANKSSSKDSSIDRDKNAVGGTGSGGGSDPYGDGRIRRGGRTTADGIAGAGSDRQRLIEEDGEGDAEGGRGRKRRPRESRIIYRDRPRYRAILGQEAEQLVTQSSRSTVKRKPTARSIAKVEGGDLPGPRVGLAKQAPKKVVVAEETGDGGWGFGKMLKWLLIIAIIIALVIFFGGQLLNYSNSDSS